MIKIKINDLLNTTETLQKLASKEMKAKLSWQIARLLKSAEKEIQDFNETRMNLINKYGEKGEDGNLITDDKGNCKITPDSVNTFSAELNELVQSEVEINANKIRIDDLENIDFTPAEMAALEIFIDFGEDE